MQTIRWRTSRALLAIEEQTQWRQLQAGMLRAYFLRLCARHALHILCLCSECHCPEGSSCTQFVTTAIPLFCVFLLGKKKLYKDRCLAAVCCCGGHNAFFFWTIGRNKLCTMLSGGLAGSGPILYKFVPYSVEMPCFVMWTYVVGNAIAAPDLVLC